MRRYLAGKQHPQQALGPRVAFVAETAGIPVGYVAGHGLLVAPACRGGHAAAGLLALAARLGDSTA
jgi:hypothetical protein